MERYISESKGAEEGSEKGSEKGSKKGIEKLSISRISFPSASIVDAKTPKTGETSTLKTAANTNDTEHHELLCIMTPLPSSFDL
jgi:hypothetical protein